MVMESIKWRWEASKGRWVGVKLHGRSVKGQRKGVEGRRKNKKVDPKALKGNERRQRCRRDVEWR